MPTSSSQISTKLKLSPLELKQRDVSISGVTKKETREIIVPKGVTAPLLKIQVETEFRLAKRQKEFEDIGKVLATREAMGKPSKVALVATGIGFAGFQTFKGFTAPILHPIKTTVGLGKLVVQPIKSAREFGGALKQRPVETIFQTGGQLLFFKTIFPKARSVRPLPKGVIVPGISRIAIPKPIRIVGTKGQIATIQIGVIKLKDLGIKIRTPIRRVTGGAELKLLRVKARIKAFKQPAIDVGKLIGARVITPFKPLGVSVTKFIPRQIKIRTRRITGRAELRLLRGREFIRGFREFKLPTIVSGKLIKEITTRPFRIGIAKTKQVGIQARGIIRRPIGRAELKLMRFEARAEAFKQPTITVGKLFKEVGTRPIRLVAPKVKAIGIRTIRTPFRRVAGRFEIKSILVKERLGKFRQSAIGTVKQFGVGLIKPIRAGGLKARDIGVRGIRTGREVGITLGKATGVVGVRVSRLLGPPTQQIRLTTGRVTRTIVRPVKVAKALTKRELRFRTENIAQRVFPTKKVVSISPPLKLGRFEFRIRDVTRIPKQAPLKVTAEVVRNLPAVKPFVFRRPFRYRVGPEAVPSARGIELKPQKPIFVRTPKGLIGSIRIGEELVQVRIKAPKAKPFAPSIEPTKKPTDILSKSVKDSLGRTQVQIVRLEKPTTKIKRPKLKLEQPKLEQVIKLKPPRVKTVEILKPPKTKITTSQLGKSIIAPALGSALTPSEDFVRRISQVPVTGIISSQAQRRRQAQISEQIKTPLPDQIISQPTAQAQRRRQAIIPRQFTEQIQKLRETPPPRIIIPPLFEPFKIPKVGKPSKKKLKAKRPTRFVPSLSAAIPEEIFGETKGPLTGLEIRKIPVEMKL